MTKSSIVCAYLYVISKYGYPPPANETLSYLKEMKELGFSTVELEGIRERHLMQMYEMRATIKKELGHLELSVPVYCTVLPGLSSQNKQERIKQIELFRFGCETAAVLDAEFVLDNCPIAPFVFPAEIPVVRHYDEDILANATLPVGFHWSTFYTMVVRVFQELCDVAAEFNLTYLMHPAVGTLFATPEAFLSFHRDVGRANLGYNFDTANLIALNQNLSLALHQLWGHIPYIHVSDTGVDKHQHLPLGAGCIDWNSFLDQLKEMKYDGYLGIDIGGAESSVANLDRSYIEALDKLQSWLS